ncbi:methyl-accepting chemotaxis protein [Janthinobacterium psychrotolerans]|uniref:Methyl-accepting chemotaxis protein-1, serine sensor receptor n=1 Tax=Janthinobacterium psychrotolerans TaxID=1747903 RepID=A0A1A7BVN0_9BURK|nr:methyl-accepting chemotaxis protein [Janthinobacterium psychrotolerans]OBV36565.1 methyl-accepting chemotaxis protein-1, serine sensor receptor [Janthinobacterium psychrotolerans]
MKNLSVRTQLALAFGAITLLLAGIAIIAIFSMSRQSASFENYVHGVRERSEAAHVVQESVGMRAVAARNLVLVTMPADRELEKKVVFKAQEEVVNNLRKLKELARDASVSDVEQRMVDKIDGIEKQYSPVALAIVDLALQEKKEEATIKINQECRPLLAALVAASNEYAQYTTLHSLELIKAAEDKFAAARNQLVLLSLLATALAIAAGILISKRLLNALGAEPVALCEAVTKVASGDLTGELPVRAGDSSSVLAAVQRMQLSLVQVVSSVRQDSELVSTAAVEISTGNNDLSSRTEQQASALEETASSMEELTSTVKQNAENARQANVLAITASDVATKGGAVVAQVVGTMESISEASRQIVDIISVIDGIAFQTNILALNAAVEAARAGEQGRGFAVVASEVRSLAHRSATAAKEIKVLIDNSVERVDLGTKFANEAGATMSEVVGSVTRVTDVIAEIVSASQEQSTGIEQINQAVSAMDNVTQKNASLVEEAAAAAESLRIQADHLVRTVSVFQIPSNGSHPVVAPTARPKLSNASKTGAAAKAPARVSSAKPAPASNVMPLSQAKARKAAAAGGDWEEF